MAFRVAKKEELKRICVACGESYYSRRNMELKTCSRLCSGITKQGVQHGERWNRMAHEGWVRNGNLERAKKRRGPKNKKFLGTKIQDGYRWIWVKHHGYMAEHRVVMARALRRKLRSREVVHHINHDKLDNRPENLKIMSRSEHLLEHLDSLLARRAKCAS